MEIKKSFGMGITALLCLLSASVTAIALVFVLSCSEPGASGGEGADFDASNYYTKSETLAMLPQCDGNIYGILDSNTSYGSGESMIRPSGYRFLLLEVAGGNEISETTVIIGDGTDEYEAVMPVNSKETLDYTYLLFFNLENYGTDLKIWSDDLAATLGINARSVMWFR